MSNVDDWVSGDGYGRDVYFSVGSGGTGYGDSVDWGVCRLDRNGEYGD